jgi:hypothetical protein
MTSLPIIWFALADYEYLKDTDLPDKSFMRSPELYQIGLTNQCFSIPIFFKYIFYAMI